MRPPTLCLIFAFSLLLCACKATTQLPARSEQIPVSVSINELVCHVRGIAAEQGFSFRYGTFTDGTGPKATFRLIGRSIELELEKWDGRPTYELSAYDNSKVDKAHRAANHAFDRFKIALVERLKRGCAN